LFFVFVYVSWRWEKIGGWILIGVAMLATVFFNLHEHFPGFYYIVVPILIPGIFLLVNAYLENGKRT
jgi:hypothetical protein